MIWRFSHASDTELVLMLDGELGERRSRRVRRHLAECGTCQQRCDRLATVATSLSRTPSATPVRGTDVHALRRLESSIDAVRREERKRSPTPHIYGSRRLQLGVAAVTFAVTVALLIDWQADRRQPVTESNFAFSTLPVSHLTPGAVRDVTTAELCGGAPATSPRIPRHVEDTVVRSYGMALVPRDDYELDYLITPELGGSADPKNLWPERYSSREWNAQVKDELEHLLPQLVCRGSISLAAAQRDIAGDWIAAYKKYFGTERPLRRYTPLPHPLGAVSSGPRRQKPS